MASNIKTSKSNKVRLSAHAPVATNAAPMQVTGMVRGMSAWLAVVRTYQKCAEVLTERIKPLGIKLAQHDVMMSLLWQPQQTQQQLAENSFVTKSHMSAVITEMQVLGWIKRADSEVDRRSKIITLTPRGLALARRAFAVQAEVVDVMMQPLSDRQIAELEKISRGAIVKLDARGE